MQQAPHKKFVKAVVFSSMLVLFISQLAFAGRGPKTYPESGKVVASGLNEHTKSRHAWSGPNGDSHGGGTYSAYSHTYKIETDTKIFEIDCGKTAMFHSNGPECGGDTKLQIGDVIHFRIEKDTFFIPLANGSEQKLRILNQELKPEPSGGQKSEAKPPDAPSDSKPH